MTDLTTITTPFGLLDRETQEALKAHGGPWEMYCGAGEWLEMDDPDWSQTCVYRVKPLPAAPPKPREWWLEREPSGLVTFAHFAPPETMDGRNELVHVREVLAE